MLSERDLRDKLEDLIHWHNAPSSVVYLQHAFGTNLSEAVENIDHQMVFLCKYGGLTPDWVERQDLMRLARLEKATMQFIKARMGANVPMLAPPNPDDDESLG